ncbi:MBL fold metallo-hydrolase [Nocardioides sp. YIM 152315]|uniref:MBL fold metallo-hydrolase n=1 Tax=Nocardioides sp. YIM 152315 TaxID=3031760 RepID=UPI0023DA19C8|nr:MBL fold metallo-hydrolase [Nocardioides sp. YIM 152315]MDF1606226.1 MBL fold metallo-hydrolase [Nocardioides sp. YIM 152315]
MNDLAATWWGHASATVEIGGARVAVDPLLSDRLFHLRRHAPSPGERARAADVVLVSHLHHDHLHLPSLRRLPREAPILVPRGGERLLRSIAGDRVRPVAPGEVVEAAGVTISVLPATHDGGRGPYTRITGPPLGFRVDAGPRSFWFPGDTELRDDMREVGPVELALVPVGGWGPTLEDGHMDPVAGAAAVARVGAHVAVPVHWGTFWPLGLRRVARANHQRLFVTPGARFVQALAEAAPTTRAVLAWPGDRVVV